MGKLVELTGRQQYLKSPLIIVPMCRRASLNILHQTLTQQQKTIAGVTRDRKEKQSEADSQGLPKLDLTGRALYDLPHDILMAESEFGAVKCHDQDGGSGWLWWFNGVWTCVTNPVTKCPQIFHSQLWY